MYGEISNSHGRFVGIAAGTDRVAPISSLMREIRDEREECRILQYKLTGCHYRIVPLLRLVLDLVQPVPG